ncbi:MAG: hypothetical protein AB7E29_14530 [Xanthobacter sp.]
MSTDRPFFLSGAHLLAATILLAYASGVVAPVRAADLSVPVAAPVASMPVKAVQPTVEDWRFQVSVYGWLTALNGDVGIRNMPTSSVNMSIGDVLGKLDGALMASALARKGNWLFLADVVYARLSEDQFTTRRGGGVLGVGLKQTVLSGLVGYMLPLTPPGLDLAVTAGARYVNLKGDMSIAPLFLPLSVNASQSQSWVDPTVGFFAQWKLNENWFVKAIADVGGFGVGSQFSSMGYAGLGYMWTQGFSTSVGYRYLYENYEGPGARTGTFRYKTMMHGPTMAMVWHF